MTNEDLLNENYYRLTLKPINTKFLPIWDLYKKQMSCFWTPEEIDFSNDKEDFKKLSDGEQYVIKMILAFFSASDGLVNLNLRERFVKEIKPIEILVAYDYQIVMENIHAEVYSDMLENIIENKDEKDRLINGFKTIESIKNIIDWGKKWIDSSEKLAYRIVAFAIIEGVFFSGAFATIFWLKKYRSQNKLFLNGLFKSNHFITRDESLHVLFACTLYNYINDKLTQYEIEGIFREAVDIAIKFTNETIQIDMIGMNTTLMNEYIKYVADRLLNLLNYNKIYNTENPFQFMESISFISKDNFFETRPDSYQKANKRCSFELLTDF